MYVQFRVRGSEYIYRLRRSSAISAQNLVIVEVQIVQIDSPGSKEIVVEHHWPDNEQCWRDQQSQQPSFRIPAEKEAVTAWGDNEHYKQASNAYSKAEGCHMDSNW
jgi:hypothetical protein